MAQPSRPVAAVTAMRLTTAQFTFVRDLVHRGAGIALDPGKGYLVEARLLGLARAAGFATVPLYLDQVALEPSGEVRRCIVEALTTNETSWFRDRKPFAAFTDVVLPELLVARADSRVLRIWSAACSSGQEPYSLAMLLTDALPAGWRYDLLATDVSGRMVARAERGHYSQVEMSRGLPTALRNRHFDQVGTGWQISPRLRSSVVFDRVNLATRLPNLGRFDVIFLRNVLIYFDQETKRSALRRIRDLLAPDGWLFLGAVETTLDLDAALTRVPAGQASVYRPTSPIPAATTDRR